ncbi:MAG: hypothetical protein ACTHY0_02260 [Mammaliicoccus vitulinus]
MKIEIELRKATKEDFIFFSHHKKNKQGKVYKIKNGKPYWCVNSDGEVELVPYKTSDSMDRKYFSKLIDRGQVYILKDERQEQF